MKQSSEIGEIRVERVKHETESGIMIEHEHKTEFARGEAGADKQRERTRVNHQTEFSMRKNWGRDTEKE